MKKWEIIINALDEPKRLDRAIAIFKLLELERQQSVEDFKRYGLEASIQMYILNKAREAKEESQKCTSRSMVDPLISNQIVVGSSPIWCSNLDKEKK